MEWLLLFLAGLGSCFGVCGLTCSPIVMPYLVLTSSNFNERIKGFFKFVLVRLVVSFIVCLLIIFLGHTVLNLFKTFKEQILILIGVVVIILGLVLMFTREKILCSFLPKDFLLKQRYEHLILGAIMGIFPCLPRLGIFSIIAFSSNNLLQGVGYFSVYSIGELISLFLILNIFHLVLTKFLSSKLRKVFSIILGGIIVFLGVNLILKSLT